MPKLDGASEGRGVLRHRVRCRSRCAGTRATAQDIRGKIGAKQKAWLCSNFRVEIGDLPCARVATVDSFTWKCAIAQDQIGIHREPTKHPAKVTVPDIKLTISMADHQAWADKAKAWFVDGQHLEERRDDRPHRVPRPAMNTSNRLGEIELQNLGFKKFSEEDARGELGEDQVASTSSSTSSR